MDSALVKVLTGIGLNDKEAKVYLACVQNGTSVVSKIGSTAGINRVTTYDILDKLKQKGLVSFFTKKKTKYFTALDPETVLEDFEKKTNELRTSLPKFKRLSGETSHPRIRYFEGLEGIKAIYTDTLSSKTEILNYSNSSEIRKQWPNYDSEYVAKRAKKKIFLRGVAPKDSKGLTVQNEDKSYHRAFRLINEENFNFTNEINIYDDKVSIISFKDELIGMIIESPEIANSQRAIFEIVWQFAELADLHAQAKNKLMEPLKGSELTASIEKTLKETLERKQQRVKKKSKSPKSEEIETTQLDSNLTLF